VVGAARSAVAPKSYRFPAQRIANEVADGVVDIQLKMGADNGEAAGDRKLENTSEQHRHNGIPPRVCFSQSRRGKARIRRPSIVFRDMGSAAGLLAID